MARHTHEFTLMYWHYGQYGPQDVHLHSCFTEDCQRVLIAKGRTCDTKAKHHRHTLTEAGPSLPPGLRQKVA